MDLRAYPVAWYQVLCPTAEPLLDMGLSDVMTASALAAGAVAVERLARGLPASVTGSVRAASLMEGGDFGPACFALLRGFAGAGFGAFEAPLALARAAAVNFAVLVRVFLAERFALA